MTDYPRWFNPRRLVAILAIFLIWSLVISLRLIQLQIFKHEEYSAWATEINEEPIIIPAWRGDIYASQMVELATSVTVSTVVAEPRKIKDIPTAVEKLAPLLGMDSRKLFIQMEDPVHRKYFMVKRKIAPKAARQIKALGINGVFLMDESLRVYPSRNLASHVLGFINMAGVGVVGLEKRYNNELHGKEGKAILEVDALGRSYEEHLLVPPVPGRSLVLSIDRDIQHLTERELASGVKKSQAKAGVAIVMESDTGRILALANYPDFNCNAYSQYKQELWRNMAVQEHFEPGSTFKGVIIAAVLNENLAKPDEVIDCQNGSMTIAGKVIHDHERYGWLTIRQVIEKSSNIGIAKLGMRLGYERFLLYIHSFGFGFRTGIDLPAEAIGLVRNNKNKLWSERSIATISFGQEIAVTPIQILTAINVIASGGYRVRPSVVDRIIDAHGATVLSNAPKRILIIRPQTAATVASTFEGVVQVGTGTKALLEGYRAAGKTGTAQKTVGDAISKKNHLASFIGFAPLPKPRVTILVQMDEPKGKSYYGGDVAAPVFQKIAQETLLRLHVPQDKDLLLTKTRSKLQSSVSGRARPSLD